MAMASNRTGLRSVQLLHVAMPFNYSSLSDRAFAVAAPLAWNNLPSHIRHISSVDKELEMLPLDMFIQTVVFSCVFVCFMCLFLFPFCALLSLSVVNLVLID